MDEPLSNLDAKLRTQTRLELVDLHRRLGTTFVYVTHDQVEAMTMADRIAVISDGRLQQVGAPQAVYERPANLFVASFIGSPPMNTLVGHAVHRGRPGHRRHRRRNGRGRRTPARPPRGRRSSLGVRPEHLRIGDGAAALRGTVQNVELLGHERHLLVAVADTMIVVRQPNDATPVTLGDHVSIVADPTGIHLFDPDTTERLN